MPGFHAPELIIILVVALLIFGPKKLPEMGSAIGKSIKEFKKGVNELSQPKEEKEKEHPQQSADASRLELEAIERELASKKAALAAQETAHAEYSATPETKSTASTDAH